MENKYVRAAVYVVVGLIVLVALLFLGDVIADNRDTADSPAFGVATSTTDESGAPMWNPENVLGSWLPWVLIGGLIVFLIYAFFAESEMFRLSTNDVVMMAIGAALYGITAWIFNIVPVPSVSLVALRPTVVIPIFFGFVFGPAVGFFVGAFGNILGDALTGWGVFPIWDIANGLMGFIPGLAGMYLRGRATGADRSNLLQILLWVSVAILALGVVLPLVSPNIVDPFSGEEANFGTWWSIMLVVLVVLLAVALAPQYWPYLLILMTVGFLGVAVYTIATAGFDPGVLVLIIVALLTGLGAYFVHSRSSAISAWLDNADTKALAIWGTIAVIIGIGFAAMADIFYNGYSFTTAFIGEFLPAAGPNILFAVILTPLLYAAWKQTRAQTGR